MAIPEGRLSTTPVEGPYFVPEGRVFYALINYERGPIAIEDTSQGLLYQDWTCSYDHATGEVTATPETTGSPVIIATIPNMVSFTFTFDQAGRISYTYTDATSSYLHWYDTALAQTVTTDLGADKITPALTMDDKRYTQPQANDMLLWYTVEEIGGGTYELFMLRQRDRFLTEYSMATGLTTPYIHNCGMNAGLRFQLTLKETVPRLPYAG